MKFAQYLNEHAVPEWKAQYLDYKQGKKKLKKINNSPFLSSLKNSANHTPALKHNNNDNNDSTGKFPITRLKDTTETQEGTPNAVDTTTQVIANTPLGGESVVSGGNRSNNRRSSLVSFQLPPPLLHNSPVILYNDRKSDHMPNRPPPQQQQQQTNDRTPLLTPQQHATATGSMNSTPQINHSDTGSSMHDYTLGRRKSRLGSFVKNLKGSMGPSSDNVHELSSYTEFSKNEFISWVDDELLKIELFYREKEQHDVERFLILQNQVLQLREQRALIKLKLKAVTEAKTKDHAKTHPLSKKGDELLSHRIVDEIDQLRLSTKNNFSKLNKFELPSLPTLYWLLGKEKQKEYYDEGYYSDEDEHPPALEDLRTSEDEDEDDEEVGSSNGTREQDQRFNKRDYSRKSKKETYKVPYYIARRQLKTALLELYRSLELLKSYRLLNHTAFRKMIKKFDKTTKSSLLSSYMEKVDQSYFNKSEILDELIPKIEDLYSANFENGNRKVAIAKLRSTEVVKTFYFDFFTSGLFIGIAIPLFILGLYKGLHDTLRGILPEGRFLLQIWGGFFLVTLMALLFGVNCYIWTKYKINYKFIFEFDNRTSIDFKQFLLIPSFSMFLIAIFGWFSFENFWPTMFPGRFWPWFFAGIMLLVMLCPFEVFYYHSRKWILTSIWRLIFSGFYPVEFRDFFLGDIFCSLTYSLSNISFFLCLYATNWKGTLTGGDTKCGSSSSRLMGFLSTLPSIWRFMQCIRRYLDTGDWFPHLANCLKYTISTIYYVLLSVYRIDRTLEHRAVFIVFAAINSIYSSIWDIFMDWSLMQAGSKNLFLRNDLIFKKSWYYYVAMIFDIVMRFQWIFYAFFAKQIQQSAVTSFCIALAELLRRFVWIFFRMENEHCTNVHLFRASRDTPLPYPVNKFLIKKKIDDYLQRIKPLEVSTPMASMIDDEERIVGLRLRKTSTTVADLADTPHLSPLTRRQSIIPAGLEKLSKMMNSAHIKDFQRRKVKPHDNFTKDGSDDEEEDNDTDEEENIAQALADQEREEYAEGRKDVLNE